MLNAIYEEWRLRGQPEIAHIPLEPRDYARSRIVNLCRLRLAGE